MDIPFFFSTDLNKDSKSLFLDETNSRHVSQVLRMRQSDPIRLVNGKGLLAAASISDPNKKKTAVDVQSVHAEPAPTNKIAIAISLVKNTARFEWFLEKATEIGIGQVIPLICQRTERQVFKQERLQNILTSAMLQSQQLWMPELILPIEFNKAIQLPDYAEKFIAHCLEDQKQSLHEQLLLSKGSRMILVGPEGDFTVEEIARAIDAGFIPVSLGETRLRTETAGMVAAVLMKLAG